jgi:hypothetical protein
MDGIGGPPKRVALAEKLSVAAWLTKGGLRRELVYRLYQGDEGMGPPCVGCNGGSMIIQMDVASV